jgi:hypothetical protein
MLGDLSSTSHATTIFDIFFQCHRDLRSFGSRATYLGFGNLDAPARDTGSLQGRPCHFVSADQPYAAIAREGLIWVTLPGLGLGLLHKPTHILIPSLPILVTYELECTISISAATGTCTWCTGTNTGTRTHTISGHGELQ